MSTASQFTGGGIKTIQRGIGFAGAASVNVTVSSVTPAKSELRLLGIYPTGGATAAGGILYLTNATTVTFTTGAASSINFSWELVERY